MKLGCTTAPAVLRAAKMNEGRMGTSAVGRVGGSGVGVAVLPCGIRPA